jgi:hypothetical protein
MTRYHQAIPVMIRTIGKTLSVTLSLLLLLACASSGNPARTETRQKGPLKVHADNPRYLSDGSGKPVYLTGSHERNNFHTSTTEKELSFFAYDRYLSLLVEHRHNFVRLWAWEDARWTPLPYLRSGPGAAHDGKPRFDVGRFNQSYFDKLRARVVAAGDLGLYVGVMLFQGWSIMNETYEPGYVAWNFHPFHRNNNVNGIDGDANRNGEGEETHTLQIPEITELQKAYARKVIDTLNDLDNVVWEISNESPAGSAPWQYEMIRYVKEYERMKPKRHLVWMSTPFPGPSHSVLFDSPADLISPHANPNIGFHYRDDPPPANGAKVIVNDTDHLAADRVELQVVWKSFTRGMHPIVIDTRLNKLDLPKDGRARAAMGHTRSYAGKMDLTAMTPQPKLSSTSYALANPGSEYLVYQPRSGPFTLELKEGAYRYEWFEPASGRVVESGRLSIEAGRRTFDPPFSGQAVLYLKSG